MAAIPPIQRPEAHDLPARPARSCMPDFIKEAFENIKAFFERVGTLNLIGSAVVLLVAYQFGILAGLAAAGVFGLYASCGAQATAAPPAAEERVERLPEGTIRSRFNQRTIREHNYAEADFAAELDEAVMPFREPIPADHNQTCCGITASLIDFFYQYGFRGLNPFRLDGMLARGIQVDAEVRRQGNLGLRRVDIAEFFEAMPEDRLHHLEFNPGQLPIQNRNYAEMIQQLIDLRPNESIAGAMFNRAHFTGLYVARNAEGEIDQIYVSESRSRFLEGVRYDSGPNTGAMVVPIGNTVEQAAANLTRYYGAGQAITTYPIFRR